MLYVIVGLVCLAVGFALGCLYLSYALHVTALRGGPCWERVHKRLLTLRANQKFVDDLEAAVRRMNEEAE